jgi:outer membrane protein assembly factor BamB
VVQDGVIYVGTEFTGVYAIDAATHAQRWNRLLGGPVRSAPAVGGGVVVVSANGLVGLSAVDGSILWQRPEIIANPDVSPMLVNGVVYIGARGPGGFGVTMYAVNASNGANAWPAPVPLPAGFDNRATVAVYPEIGLLFAGLGPTPGEVRPDVAPSGLVALRLTDGAPAWGAPAVFIADTPPAGMSLGWVSFSGGSNTPQAAVFVSAGQYVMAFSATTGVTLWVRIMPESVNPAPPVVSTNAQQASTLYVAGASGRVYALDSNTGADLPGGLTQPLGPVAGTLALAGPYLYVPTAAGLVAADAASGAVLWTSPLSAASGVAVAGGIPYVGTADGRLVGYAAQVAPPPPPPPPPAQVRDLSIVGIEVQPIYSRSQRGEVFVNLVNRGAQAEQYHIYLRSQPGVPINDYIDSIGPGQTKRIGFYWPTNMMGGNGQKSLISQVVIIGASDANPADNIFEQPVTVGP